MSLIEFSLNDVFIKFAHIEIPLFKVSHYLHCTLRLLAIYFFFLYWACPLSNFMHVGEPNTPSCFRKHWECQSQVIASRGKDWTIYRRPFVRSTQIIFVIIGQMLNVIHLWNIISISGRPFYVKRRHIANNQYYTFLYINPIYTIDWLHSSLLIGITRIFTIHGSTHKFFMLKINDFNIRVVPRFSNSFSSFGRRQIEVISIQALTASAFQMISYAKVCFLSDNQ